MSKTVDTRVVEMKFDNKNFEANVSQSMSTLDKLKKALKLDGVAEGFEKIDKASGKVNLNPLQRACEKASEGFSGLEVVAVSALATITSQAVMAGERMIKALSVDQIMSGFNEYELKMGSTQTIMAATGADLSTVKKYLQELNEYADRTIYSFSDMTSNIGKFTNAGVKLDDAVLAMKGISNEAAVSGANAEEASRAMYNFSQALSMGYVQYADWRSIENANMATVEFKQNLADAAIKMGTVQKAGEGIYKVGDKTYTLQALFKDAMKDQWLTTDVLIGTLRDYADETTEIGKKAYAAAQDVKTWTQLVDTTKEAIGSGWAETFELIVGDFDEAKELFTRMSNAIDKVVGSISNARNKFIGDALSSNYTKLTTKLEDAGITASQLQEKLKEIGSAKGISYDSIISEAGSLSKAMRTGKIDTEDLKSAINQLIGTSDDAVAANTQVGLSLEELGDVARKVYMGEFGNGADRVKALTDAGYDYAQVQAAVDRIVNDSNADLSDLVKTTETATSSNSENAEAIRKLREELGDADSETNKMLDHMSELSGREMIIESLGIHFTNLGKIIGSVGAAFRQVFTFDGSDLNALIGKFYIFSNRVKITDEQTDKLRRTFAGLFSVLHIVSTLASALLKIGLRILNSVLGKLGYEVLDLTAGIGDLLVKLDQWITNNKYIEKGIDTVSTGIVFLIRKIWQLIDAAKSSEKINAIVSTVQSKFSSFTKFIKSEFKMAITEVPKWFEGLIESFKLFGKHTDEIGVSTANAGKIFKAFNDDVGQYTMATIGASDATRDAANNTNTLLGTLVGVIKNAYGWLLQYVDGAKSFIDEHVNILNVIAAIMGLGIIEFLWNIKAVLGSVMGPLQAVTDMILAAKGVFGSIAGTFKMLTKVFSLFRFTTVAAGVLLLSFSILSLAASMKVISTIPKEKLWQTTGAIIGLAVAVSVMAAAIALLNKYQAAKLEASGWANNIAIEFLALAISVGIVAGALNMISKAAKGPGFVGGLAGLIVVIGVIAVIEGLLNYQSSRLGKIENYGKQFGKIAKALLVMSISLAILSRIPAGKLWSAVGAVSVMAIVMGALAIAFAAFDVELAPLAGLIAGSTVGVLLVAAGVYILERTFERLCNFFTKLAKTADDASTKATIVATALGTLALGIYGVVQAVKKINKAGGSSANIAIKMGGTFLGIGVGLLAFSVAVDVMRRLIRKDTNATLIATVTILGVASGLIVMLHKFPLLGAEKQRSLFGTLVGIGLCMVLISGAFALATVAVKYSNPAIAAGIAVGIAGIIAVIGFAAKNASGIEKGTATFISLAICIGAITVCILLLSTLRDDINGVGDAAGALALVIGALAVLMYSISQTKNLTTSAMGTLLALGVVIALIGGTLYALTMAFSSADTTTIIASIGTLAVIMIGLTLCMQYLSNMNSISQTSIGAVLAVGIVIVAIIGAMNLLAQNDWSAILVSCLGVAAVIVALGFALGKLAALQAMSVTSIGAIVAVGVIVALMSLAFGRLAQNDWSAILAATLGMAAVIVAMGITMNMIAGMSGLAMTSMLTMVVLGGVVALMALAFGQLAQNDWTSILAACLGMAAVLLAMSVALSILAPMSGPAAMAGAAMIELGVALLLIAGAAVLFSIALDNILTGLVNFIQGIKDVFGIHSPSKVFEEIGDFIMQGFANGITGMFDSVVGFFGDLGTRIKNAITGWFSDLKEKGKALMNKVGEGISNAKEAVANKVKDVGNKIKDTLGGFKDKIKEVGGNMMDGLKNGITGAAENVKNAVAGVANSAVDKFKSLLGIHSPSRVFAGFGENISQGLANGINKVKGKVTEAIGGMGEDIKSTMQSYMGDITSSMEDFKPEMDTSEIEQQVADLQNQAMFDYQPTITPVFDGSEVYAGLGDINSQFAAQSYDLASTASFDYDKSLFDKFEANQNGLNVNNSDVVSAISSLNNRMDQMAQAISSLQIVMDTGTLVGSIAEPMDNALGQRMVFAGRGI